MREWTLIDDGTMDTVVACPMGHEARFSTECAAYYRDSDGAFSTKGFLEFVRAEVEPEGCYDCDSD